jgi:hypothetical protein
MSIFDEAIREHLELKRQHGAADTELRKLEDEAFGPPARPGEVEPPAGVPEGEGLEAATAAPEPADATSDHLPPAATTQPVVQPAEPAPPPAETGEPLPEAAEPVHGGDEHPTEAPLSEEHPAMEHRTVDPASTEAEIEAADTVEHPPPLPPDPEGTSITERPTELYDHGEGMAPEEGVPPDERALEDEFFSEQSLSDELDHALEGPGTEPAPRSPDSDESLPPAGEQSVGEEAGAADEDPEDEGDDVLEETPEFLQDTPEHDRLWFEQKPPKDFDFDD